VNHVLYRLEQGWHHLISSRAQVDYHLVTSVLDEPALMLFEQMSPADQAHACRVLEVLQASGPISCDLAQAALLHDVGKAQAGLSIFYRTWIILLRRIAPGWLVKLSANPGSAWQRPFYFQARHARDGARLAQMAGCGQRTVWLIEHHDLPPGNGIDMIIDTELQALQAADDIC